MKPARGEAPYPTILVYSRRSASAAYGYGFHFDFQMLAGAGYGVLFLNHRASTGYGDSFSTAIKGDWGNLDYQDLMSWRRSCGPFPWGWQMPTGLVSAGPIRRREPVLLDRRADQDRFKAAIPQNPVTNWRSFYGTSDIGIYFGVEQIGWASPRRFRKSTTIARP